MSVSQVATIPAIRVLDDELRLLLRSSASPNRMSAMHVEVAPGAGVPPHTHRSEEEGYFVLEGTLSLTLGEAEHRLEPGGFAHVPAGVVHGYRNAEAHPVRFLAWTVGGPIDEFFLELSERVRSMPADAPAMMEIMDRYGVTMAH